MNVTTLLWSFAVFLASAFAATLTAVTLVPKYGKNRMWGAWLLLGAAGYIAAYISYSVNLLNDTFGILGLSVIVCIGGVLLYEGTRSAKLFVSLTSCLIANVCTFMFCGTTDTLLAGRLGLIKVSPYDVPNLLFFIGIKAFVYCIIFVLYRKFMRKTVIEMIEALGGNLKSFILAPAVSVIGFYVINLFTNTHGIFPNVFWFFPLYLTVCIIFVIEFWLIFDSVLASARAMKNAAELNVATNIQQSMLPSIFPAFPERTEFDIYATMTPAKEVGGDFYDFFLVDDDHLAMVMADVSGKGVPAALFMMISKTLIKNAAGTGLSPKAVLEKVNNQLCENNEAEMFVTVWLGILEISTGKMRCANAGHEYPAIRRKDGSFQLYKDKHGFVLAGMEGTRYKEYELELAEGDSIFVYTDGVPEATDARNELYGTDRMLSALNKGSAGSCKALLESLYEDIGVFVGNAPQFDDITMLCLSMKPQGEDSMKKISVSPDLACMEEAVGFFETFLEEAEAPPKVLAQVNVAVDEIFSNIARYSQADSVVLGCRASAHSITLRFTDNGRPYDPTSAPEPDIHQSAEEREIGGLGIFMVKKTMDTVEYEYTDGLNVLTLVKEW